MTEASSPDAPPIDAFLLLSFGGPEKMEDVLPFLENVVRGKNVPKERLLEVVKHYERFDGISPINGQNREFIAALEASFREAGIELPIYWGNRNWHPMLEETVAKMKADGVQHALCLATSAFGSYSGCRQYRQDIDKAREAVEGAPKITKVRHFFNHPGFINAMVDSVQKALRGFPEGSSPRIAFTAHSIPNAMAKTGPYQEQLLEACRLVAEAVGCSQYQLVYQSRSGPPQVPWLEPDILDHLQALAAIGVEDLVIAPIGFVSDHMEVVWDLDHEARDLCAELGIRMARTPTVGVHPTFVDGMRELVQEYLEPGSRRQSLGVLGPSGECAPGCCDYVPRRPGRPGGRPASG